MKAHTEICRTCRFLPCNTCRKKKNECAHRNLSYECFSAFRYDIFRFLCTLLFLFFFSCRCCKAETYTYDRSQFARSFFFFFLQVFFLCALSFFFFFPGGVQGRNLHLRQISVCAFIFIFFSFFSWRCSRQKTTLTTDLCVRVHFHFIFEWFVFEWP